VSDGPLCVHRIPVGIDAGMWAELCYAEALLDDEPTAGPVARGWRLEMT
jgi:hypothetical protein